MTKWTDFAKAFASKYNMSYKEALSKCKDEYSKSKGTVEGGKLSAGDLKGLLDASYDGRESVGDFIIDKALSTSNTKVYHNPATNQAVVAHKGTTGITDWGNNAVYALFGNTGYKQTQRFKDAEKVQKEAEKKYGASNISTIGHSQAGLQAELLGKKSNEIITLDKATRPFGNTKSKNQVDIRSSNDIVSAANPFQKSNKKEIVLKNKSLNPLVAHDIGQLDKLAPDTVIGQGMCAKCMKKLKSKKTIKGGVINNALLLLPDLAFVNVLESISSWVDLQSMATTFQNILNEGGLTEEELLLVTNRLELVNNQIEALRRKPTPPPSPTSYKRGDSPPSPPRKGKRGGDDFSFSFGGVNKKTK